MRGTYCPSISLDDPLGVPRLAIRTVPDSTRYSPVRLALPSSATVSSAASVVTGAHAAMERGDVDRSSHWILPVGTASRIAVAPGPSIAPAGRSLETFDGYAVSWKGRSLRLDRHLKRGKGSDMRASLRVYSTWGRETRSVVIGRVPTRLDCWTTN